MQEAQQTLGYLSEVQFACLQKATISSYTATIRTSILSRAQPELKHFQETFCQVEESVMCAEGVNLIDFGPLFQYMDALRQTMSDTE